MKAIQLGLIQHHRITHIYTIVACIARLMIKIAYNAILGILKIHKPQQFVENATLPIQIVLFALQLEPALIVILITILQVQLPAQHAPSQIVNSAQMAPKPASSVRKITGTGQFQAITLFANLVGLTTLPVVQQLGQPNAPTSTTSELKVMDLAHTPIVSKL